MTSLASLRMLGGTMMPSACAVLRLITSSNLVAICTGITEPAGQTTSPILRKYGVNVLMKRIDATTAQQIPGPENSVAVLRLSGSDRFGPGLPGSSNLHAHAYSLRDPSGPRGGVSLWAMRRGVAAAPSVCGAG